MARQLTFCVEISGVVFSSLNVGAVAVTLHLLSEVLQKETRREIAVCSRVGLGPASP